MEYTDAPTIEPETEFTDTMPCPYCGTPLPKDAQRCTRCDWKRQATETAEPKASDAMAVLLSVIPGLGHIYKGHRMIGAILLFIVTPIAIAFGFLAAFASAGFGIGILIFYWLGVMLHVWGSKDRIAPNITDEGEQVPESSKPQAPSFRETPGSNTVAAVYDRRSNYATLIERRYSHPRTAA